MLQKSPFSFAHPCFLIIALVVLFSDLLAQGSSEKAVDGTIFLSQSTVFLPGHAYASGDQNWSVTTADMNGDSLLDLISAAKLDGQVHVHFNDGKGGFIQRKSFDAYKNLRAICSFDANQDKHPDIACVSLSGKLIILLNDGRGNLSVSQILETGSMAHDVTPADLTGDGRIDLITAVVNAHALKLHISKGDGTFEAGVPIPTGRKPRVVKVGDLNGDGLDDLVVGGDNGRLYLHLQKEKHLFDSPRSIRSTAATWGLELGDFDGNGSLDIAAASYLDKNLFIHLNKGDATFEREQEIISGDHNFDVAVADFDLDGDLDVATCSILDRALNLHLNDGTGIIGPRNEIQSGDWNAGIDVGDFDGDGDPDLVLASVNDRTLVVHRNLSANQDTSSHKQFCLRGIVFDDDTKQPLPKVQVVLKTEAGNTFDVVQTGEQGEYQFCPPVLRTYEISVRTANWPVYREGFEMPDQDLEKHIYLSKPKGSFIYGTVRDARNNRLLRQATLELRNAGGELMLTFLTDSAGSYRKEIPFDDAYLLEASALGYESEHSSFDLTEAHVGKGKRINFQLEKPRTACLTGFVLEDSSLLPLAGAKLMVTALESQRQKPYVAGPDAFFEMCLPFGEYEIHAKQPGYFFKTISVRISPEEAETGKKQDILLQPLKKDAVIVLEHIFYDVDKATLRDVSLAELDRVLEIMDENPSLVVEISSHTDSDATDDYNQVLSEARANVVVEYLLASGINSGRMQAKGYGETQPIVSNDTAANKQKNRRTEFRVLAWEGNELQE